MLANHRRGAAAVRGPRPQSASQPRERGGGGSAQRGGRAAGGKPPSPLPRRRRKVLEWEETVAGSIL
uniref:Uncharacterized protein n=1 Tax=Arundo donax TaxID=35708 RepID=A0A0A9BRC3_ARUDO